MGSQRLLCLFVSFRVLTCVCLGPSVQLSPPDFVRDILVLVCAVTPALDPGSRAGTPTLQCLNCECIFFISLVEKA